MNVCLAPIEKWLYTFSIEIQNLIKQIVASASVDSGGGGKSNNSNNKLQLLYTIESTDKVVLCCVELMGHI